MLPNTDFTHQPAPRERRSWHYPEPWSGVVWQPSPTPIVDAIRAARAAFAVAVRAFTAAMIVGTVLTVAIGVAASAGVK